MKRVYKILILLGIFFIIHCSYGICSSYATDIRIKDENMYNKVLEELKVRYNLKPETRTENSNDNTMYIVIMGNEDIAKVKELQLNNIDMESLHGIEYFTNLQIINISNNNLSNISKLQSLENLVTVIAYGNRIEDLSPLSGKTTIKYLNVAKNRIVDTLGSDKDNANQLLQLSGLTSLIELDVSRNNIKYTNGIESLINLKKLNLYDNALYSITGISALTGLTELKLGYNNERLGNKQHNILGLSELNSLTNLKHLEFSNNNIPGILSNISSLTKLEALQIEGNQITDISEISSFKQLKSLNLYNNLVENISALRGLTNLEEVVLGKNNIKDISLIISNNNIIWQNLKKIDLSSNEPLYTKASTESNTTRIDNNDNIIKQLVQKNIEVNYEYITDTSNLPHTDSNNVKYVTYDDFGAKCNGTYDDFIAIRNAHLFANKNNCEVRATTGKTYHIFKYYEDAVFVNTSIDWKNANIIIHDEDIEEVSGRFKEIFKVTNITEIVTINNPTWTINKNTKSIKNNISTQLAQLNQKGYSQYLCEAVNDNVKHFIRSGGSSNSGSSQQDSFIIDAEGNLLNDVQWDFSQITSFTISAIPNSEINITNANITTNNIRSKSELNNTSGKTQYYRRNIYIGEAGNVNISGIKHTLPEDTLSGSYYGLIEVNTVANLNISDCQLHTRKFSLTGRSTYGLTLAKVVNCNCKNIISNDIEDSHRWGITGTNYCKDIVFDNCSFNRLDAHKGLYNLTLKNCNIGYWGLSITGQGELLVDNTTIIAPTFIPLRQDYGSTWNGNVYIINSTHKYINSQLSYTGSDVPKLLGFLVSLDSDGKVHDYGYECELPNVYVENLTIDLGNSDQNCLYVIPNEDEKCNKLADSYWPENVYINGYKFENVNPKFTNASIKLKQTDYGNINTDFVVTDCKLKLNGSSTEDVTDKLDFNKELKTNKDVTFEIAPNTSATNKISIYKNNNEKIVENKTVDKALSYQLTEKGAYKIVINSTENVNNNQGTKEYEFNIDKTVLPLELSVSYLPTKPTKGNVVATITANQEIQETGDWKFKDDSKTALVKTYTENATETVNVKDNAGNEAEATININNIDKTAPELQITYSTSKPTKENVVATITANEEIQETGDWKFKDDSKTALVKTYTENATETVHVKDKLGNEAEATININNIDKTAPELQITYSTNKPTKENVVATITANEEIQETGDWKFKDDSKTSLIKTYTENATETVHVKDNAGNEAEATININNIDKTNLDLIVTYSTTLPTNEDVVATITANEEIQETGDWKFKDDSKTALVKTYTENATETVNVKDNAGNEAEATININNIDKTSPELQITYSTNKPTKENVIATITANEEIQETGDWKFKDDSKTVLVKTYTENATETVNVKDNAGNEAETIIDIHNIDKTNLDLIVTYSTTLPTNEDVVATITANKEIQEVGDWKFKDDSKTSLIKTYTQNTTESIEVKDTAGYTTIANIEINNIDKDELVATVKYSTKEQTLNDVIVTIETNKYIQEIEGWEILKDKKSLSKTYTQNAEETVTIYDIAGNSVEKTITIENIDKEKPKYEVNYSTTLSTNEDVTVTITGNEEFQSIKGWIISDDKKVLTKTYSENTEEEITIKDLAGNSSKTVIKINNIDKVKPEIKIDYNISKEIGKHVIVTITSNEPLIGKEGWTLSDDKKTLTKEFSTNTDEEITFTDLAGNTTTANIKVQNIDKTENNQDNITKNDATTAKSALPKTGGSNILIIIAVFFIISIIIYILIQKNKYY